MHTMEKSFPLAVVLIIVLHTVCGTKVTTTIITRETLYVNEGGICNIGERKKVGCAKEVLDVRGKFDCVRKCEDDDFCVAASMDGDDDDAAGMTTTCFHHETCQVKVSCSEGDETHTRAWNSYCVHGTWDKPTQSCVCRHGTSGVRCDQYISDCYGLITAGYSQGRHMTLLDFDRDGENPIKARCYIRPPDYRYVILLINDGLLGSMSFNRTWDEYVNGFYEPGDNSKNMWLGLRNWHLLSSVGCSYLAWNLIFPMGDVILITTGFRVRDESANYAFTFSSAKEPRTRATPPSGDVFGNCFASLRNVPFSTWDRNNNNDVTTTSSNSSPGGEGEGEENCAARRGSGWWRHPGCSNDTTTCNLLGLHDWPGTRTNQRMMVSGVDMERAKAWPLSVLVYYKC